MNEYYFGILYKFLPDSYGVTAMETGNTIA